MKKFLLTILLASLLLIAGNVYAWDDCPKGIENDPYPGVCSKYIDTDNDGICDHSQPAPEDREENSVQEATVTENDSKENSVNSDSSDTPTVISETNEQTEMTTSQTQDSVKTSTYNFWIIFITLTIIYLISELLVKFKIINLMAHRKFWNLLLLVSFLICGITGILLTIRIDNPELITIPNNFLFLHVEFGIAMALISIFHIIWHWQYYKMIFKFNKK